MLFFLKIEKQNNSNGKCFNVVCKFDIKAALIGSSNQSYLTYFGPRYDKGEADIFIIDSRVNVSAKALHNGHNLENDLILFTKNEVEENNTKIFLSKQIDFKNCETLNDIFGEYVASCIK